MSWWVIALASLTSATVEAPLVRLDVVAGEPGVSAERIGALRTWLRAALEKEGVVFDEQSTELPARYGTASRLVVELREGEWRVWRGEAKENALVVDAEDFELASLETLHHASLLLSDAASAESTPSTPVAPETPPSVQPTPPAAPSPPVSDAGVDFNLRSPIAQPFQRQWWTNLTMGAVVSTRTAPLAQLVGTVLLSPQWGASLAFGASYSGSIEPVDSSWVLALWDFEVTAGPVLTLPLGQHFRFNAGVRAGLGVHMSHFTGETWEIRPYGLAKLPLGVVYQTPDWRLGLCAEVAASPASFTHRVFESPVWNSEHLYASALATWGSKW